ncbi:MAG: type II secretion system F family protein [Phycisphaerae bacterium]|nr:type II secretion system F family protein [Phycisphaerae bacterium]
MSNWAILIFDAFIIAGLGAAGLFLLGALTRATVVWFWRYQVERTVIGQMSSVVRQNLPLATALALAAESEPAWAGRALRRIAKLLGQGLSLSQAARLGFADCSPLVLSLIAAGEKAGQLPAALQQAEQYLDDREHRRHHPDMPVWPYVVSIVCAITLLTAGIMVLIVPKLVEIFADFGVTLPPLTRLLINASAWFAHGTPPGWTQASLLVGLSIYLGLRRRRFPDPGIITRLADWLRWHVPGARRMAFGQGMSVALRTMRLAVRSGMSIEPAARLAADLDVNLHLRRRLSRFADLLAVGTDLAQASQTAGLGRVTTTALANGQRTGNLDVALRYAGDYHDTVISRWWIVIRKLAWPASTLAMATVVAFVVIAMFLPLVCLINSVCGPV